VEETSGFGLVPSPNIAEPVIGRAFARPVGCVPSMIGSLEVKVFYPA